MKNFEPKLTGIALAIAAAGIAGCATPADKSSMTAAAKATTTDMVHCYDANVCKGHNDCKTAANSCAGHGSCKGQGFVAVPSKTCGDIGGSQKDEWMGSINTADLAHCYDVNVCKGHNDCKTANNSCAGHASCKGQGFVAAPAKACADLGGKVKS